MDISILPQLVLSGIVLGAPLAVLGLGMSLILNVTHRFHFAYALTFTLAAFVAAVLSTRLGIPSWIAMVAAVLAGAAAGVLIEIVVYRPLIRRSGEVGGLLPVFVSSLGLTIAGQSAMQLAWASQSVSVPFTMMPTTPLPLPFELRMTNFDLTTLIVFSVIGFGGAAVLRYTRAGQIVRGVQGNPTMAKAVGINPDTVYVWVFALASGAAALAACFAAVRSSATAGMGFEPLFSSFVVAFIAGPRAPALRVVLIGFALGVVQSVSTLWIPVTLTNLVVFGLLFFYLAAKGTDLLGLVTRIPRRA